MEKISEVLSDVVGEDCLIIPRHAFISFYEGVLKIAGFGFGGMLVMAGKKAGGKLAEQFKEKLGREVTIEEAMTVISKLFEFTRTGTDMEISVEDDRLKLSMKDSFLAKDLNNKKTICKPIAGIIMGFFGGITGKIIKVRETHCVAQGEKECLFEGKITS